VAIDLILWRFFSFRGYAAARWLTLHTWTHSAIFSASIAEPNSPLTAHLDLRNSTDDSVSGSYVMTDGLSASLSWNKAPNWGLRPDFYYCRTVAGLLMWGALPDEKTGLSFTIAAGPGQRSHFRVRVPWDSRSYFTVSDLRLPFSSPPTTCRVTVEVFDSVSTRVYCRFSTELFFVTTLHGPNTKHRSQQFLYCYLRIRCRGNLFIKPLPSKDVSSGSTIPAFRRHIILFLPRFSLKIYIYWMGRFPYCRCGRLVGAGEPAAACTHSSAHAIL
jgi:hypothetical protein